MAQVEIDNALDSAMHGKLDFLYVSPNGWVRKFSRRAYHACRSGSLRWTSALLQPMGLRFPTAYISRHPLPFAKHTRSTRDRAHRIRTEAKW